MIARIPKKGKKRQYNPKSKNLGKERRIQQPEDQSFDSGISLTMDTYGYNAVTGDRDRKIGRETVRFPNGIGISDFYEQNRKIVYKNREGEENASSCLEQTTRS